MIVIPLTKNFSWRNPPLLTIALIVVNCFIFAAFQHNDDHYWQEAFHFYFDSGLGEMEIGLYQEYLQRTGSGSDKENASSRKLSVEEKRYAYFHEIVDNAEFRRMVAQGAILPATDSRLEEWRQLRTEFETILHRVVAYKYGFRPAYPRLLTWLSSMFLHGGWGHLIGNMIFLWLIGAMIEYGCRHAVFPVLYIVGGAGGDVLFWLLNSNSAMPCVGASGAISGIMGAFTVLYGLKRVNIFINLGFYFNYVKFPALLLLPFWMGHELFQLHFDQWSNVGYAAHLGGLGTGAVLACLAKIVHGCLDANAFVAAEEDKVAPLLERALAHMGALEFAEARLALEEALESEPDNLTVWQHLFTIDRQNPEAPQFHHTTARLMDLLCQHPEHAAKACAIFREYSGVAKPPRLSADHYIRVSRCFIDDGDLGAARRILWTLVKKAKHLEDLPMALFRLAQGFQRNKQTGDYLECLQVIESHFPMSGVARVAGEQLKKPNIAKGSHPL
jgi:membrane associated rhomboid family serine protease